MNTVPADLSDLASRLDQAELSDRWGADRRPGGGRRAAVLILLFECGEGYQVVFVEKSARLRSHAGQIAFPGGSLEPGETNPVQAALREAAEEAGIVPASVEVLGVLPSAHIPRSGFDVTSVVGWWREPAALATADPYEIAAVHTIAVPALLDPGNRLTWTLPRGASGPAFVVGDLFIWGFTALALDALFDLLSWSLPWDETRTAEVPSRFYNPD